MSSAAVLSPALQARLQPLLSAELKRLLDEEPDENLSEYLVLLLASGRSEADITSDLTEFWGGDVAAALAKFIVALYQQHLAPGAAGAAATATPLSPDTKTKSSGSKRTRDEAAESSPASATTKATAAAPAASSSSTSGARSSSSSDRRSGGASSSDRAPERSSSSAAAKKPDQERFVPGRGGAGARLLGAAMDREPGSRDGARSSARGRDSTRESDSSMRESSRDARSTRGSPAVQTPSSVILVQRKSSPAESSPPADEEPSKRSKVVVRTRGMTTEGIEEAKQSPPAVVPSSTSFKVTFDGTKGSRQLMTAAAAAESAAAPVKKRLVITKGGKEVSPSPTPAAAEASPALLPTPAAAVAAAKPQAAPARQRQFGSGFAGPAAASASPVLSPVPIAAPVPAAAPVVAPPPKVILLRPKEKEVPVQPAYQQQQMQQNQPLLQLAPQSQPQQLLPQSNTLLPTPAAAYSEDAVEEGEEILADYMDEQEGEMVEQQQPQQPQQQQQPYYNSPQPSAFARPSNGSMFVQQSYSGFKPQSQSPPLLPMQAPFGGGAPSLFAGGAPSAFATGGAVAAGEKVKCRFFPNCTNPSCPFVHPSSPCPHYPNCNRGELCLLLHPAAAPPCRFGMECTKAGCTFSHPPGHKMRGGGVGGGLEGGFRGGRGGAAARGGRGGGRGGRGGLTGSLQTANTPCKFGAKCTRDDCIFSHPSGSSYTSSHSTLDLSAPFSAAPAFQQPQPGPNLTSATDIAARFLAIRNAQAKAAQQG